MFAEGTTLTACRLEVTLEVQRGTEITAHAMAADGALPVALQASDVARLKLTAIKPMPMARLPRDAEVSNHAAGTSGRRSVLFEGGPRDLPVIRLEEQAPGAEATGPLVLEEAYLTGKVGEGWRFTLSASRDIVLARL